MSDERIRAKQASKARGRNAAIVNFNLYTVVNTMASNKHNTTRRTYIGRVTKFRPDNPAQRDAQRRHVGRETSVLA